MNDATRPPPKELLDLSGQIVLVTGATGAIDRMQQLVGVKLPAASRALLDGLMSAFFGQQQAADFETYCRQHQPVVFVGPYEHHSNEISWRQGLATVVEVNLAADGGIDHADASGVRPDVLIGDLDSLSPHSIRQCVHVAEYSDSK